MDKHKSMLSVSGHVTYKNAKILERKAHYEKHEWWVFLSFLGTKTVKGMNCTMYFSLLRTKTIKCMKSTIWKGNEIYRNVFFECLLQGWHQKAKNHGDNTTLQKTYFEYFWATYVPKRYNACNIPFMEKESNIIKIEFYECLLAFYVQKRLNEC